jgi:FkbM family methyltransferase
VSRAAQRLDTLRTPWKLAYAARRRAMLAALAATAPLRPRPNLERLGSGYGGWTVPTDLIGPDWTCLCAGAGIDVTFDLALVERFGAAVITVDPTDESREHIARADADGRLRFVHAALWREDGELEMFVAADPQHRTLSSDDLQRTGRSVRVPARGIAGFGSVDLVKLDIEGAEYDVLPMIGPEVRVLCVEMHPTRGLRAAVRAFRRLRASGFELVARHGADFTFLRTRQPRAAGRPPGR